MWILAIIYDKIDIGKSDILKTIKDFDLNNKKIIIRVDFNVPIKDSKILDDNRIVNSIETIKYAIDKGGKVILLSHLGRVKSEEDKVKNDLSIVVPRLSELLGINVKFCEYTRGSKLENMVSELNNGEVLLVQNTRYEDFPNKLESGNDLDLGNYWASLGDIFINDAFGTAHRAHASNVGIASNLDSGIGFLMEKELKVLNGVKDNPKKPYTVILGGAKVNDKIGVINALVEIADYILIGGGMSYTFLKAMDKNIGSSLLDSESIDYCKNLISKYRDKIILPIDNVVCNEISDEASSRSCSIEDIKEDEIGVDIGAKSVELFKKYLSNSKTVVWNGTMGCHEYDDFANGTKDILEFLSNIDCETIICGGDTASAAINFGYKDKFTHISTGGGASLELLEGKKLPGVEAIENK